MASISKQKNGGKIIQFGGGRRKRKSIRLGKVPMKTAEEIKVRVQHLDAAKESNTSIDAETAQWVASIGDTLAAKLAAVDLIPARQAKAVLTLGPFITSYVASRTDVKPATKEVWRQGENGLVEFFGANKPLTEVTPGDADAYKLHLIGKKLASFTVRKRLQFATMIFRAAWRRRLIAESPFVEVTIKAAMPDRMHFITSEDTQKLLDACPNVHWKAIIVLSRYGGLRCPSEVLSLRWADIDRQANTINVRSPKTEHHPGKEARLIPLFAELVEVLDECRRAAGEEAVYIIDERMHAAAQGPSGWRNCNLRTTFAKIVERAGLKPWPRLFHNLRSSRQTELAEEFSLKAACKWLGNSVKVADEHYLQIKPEHFAQAVAGKPAGAAASEAKPLENVVQQAAAASRDISHEIIVSANTPTPYAKPCETTRDTAQTFSGWRGIRTPVTFR